MRRSADRDRIGRFLRELGRRTSSQATIYLSGGATAVLSGWRSSTIDIDIRVEPEAEDVLRLMAALKDELQVNVELASPLDFIPEPAGWRDRSPFIAQEGALTFRNLDPYAQALAKIERDHPLDQADVRSMLASGLVTIDRLRELYDVLERELYRFPAIDPPAFRSRFERTIRDA